MSSRESSLVKKNQPDKACFATLNMEVPSCENADRREHGQEVTRDRSDPDARSSYHVIETSTRGETRFHLSDSGEGTGLPSPSRNRSTSDWKYCGNPWAVEMA